MPGVGTTHHVKIGDDLHLVRQGTYSKRGAPQFGARFTTGDPDYNNLSAWQYWVQRCWVGGFGAEVWMDDAMFDEAVGVDTSQHDVAVLARDLSITAGGTLEGDLGRRKFEVFGGKLYCLAYGDSSGTSKLWRWDPPQQKWVKVHTFMNPCRDLEVFNQKLCIGDHGSTFTYMKPDETFVNFAKPGGVGSTTPFAMKEYRGRLYVAFENEIWRLKKDFTWDGSTVFHTAEGVDRIVAMEVHLGFLYMASQNGHILRTDGNNTFDLWQFDPGNEIKSIRSFDGRLFISVDEPLDGTSARQAVLYQFSGAAVTELKRWGKSNRDTTTGELRVIGHRMFFGAASLLGMGDGFGVACYDPREDAYHLWASNRDDLTYVGGTEGWNWGVDDVIYYGGSVFASVRGYGIFRAYLRFKDVSRFEATYDTTAVGVSPTAGNGGTLTSSDFDAGTPGLLKYWDAITVHVDLPEIDCTVFVEVSTDGGIDWHQVGLVEKTGPATRYAATLPLTGVAEAGKPLTGTRLKWRLTLRTTTTTRSPQLRGVVVRYLPIPEPNWQWEMTLVLSDTQELLDGSTEENVDVAAKLANLETAFRTQTPVHFTDIDGTEWGPGGAKLALVTDLRQSIPFVGPGADGPIEREVRVVLLEVKDAYEVVS